MADEIDLANLTAAQLVELFRLLSELDQARLDSDNYLSEMLAKEPDQTPAQARLVALWATYQNELSKKSSAAIARIVAGAPANPSDLN